MPLVVGWLHVAAESLALMKTVPTFAQSSKDNLMGQSYNEFNYHNHVSPYITLPFP